MLSGRTSSVLVLTTLGALAASATCLFALSYGLRNLGNDSVSLLDVSVTCKEEILHADMATPINSAFLQKCLCGQDLRCEYCEDGEVNNNVHPHRVCEFRRHPEWSVQRNICTHENCVST